MMTGMRGVERTMPRASALVLAMLACARQDPPEEQPNPIPEVDGAAFVDPFIGTAGEGYTFPGAVAPWGMISISPHNLVADALDYVEGRPIAPAGYLFGEPELFGFGLTQLSGVGCQELGVPRISISTGELGIPSTEVGTAYENEQASPGHYAVELPNEGIQLEATVTERAGILRATIDAGAEAKLYVDAGSGLAWIAADGHVSVRSSTEIEGWARTGNFCAKGNEQRVHFALRLSSPSSPSIPSMDAGTWMEGTIGDASEADGSDVGAFMRIDGATIDVRVGISYVSIENAWANLDAEVGTRELEEVREQTRETWSELLSRIQVEGGSNEQRTIFYTALYHALLHPNVFSDVDGSVPSMNGEIVTVDSPRYTVYSMWDSYRTVHPLLSLVYPERQDEMIRSLAAMTLEYGAPPQWELAASEVNMMVGDPAASVFADAVLGGFEDFDVEAVYQSLTRCSISMPHLRASPATTTAARCRLGMCSRRWVCIPTARAASASASRGLLSIGSASVARSRLRRPVRIDGCSTAKRSTARPSAARNCVKAGASRRREG